MLGLHEGKAAVAWMRLVPLVPLLLLPRSGLADPLDDLMERGRWKEARAAAASLEPGKPRTFYVQSRIQLAFGEAEQALASAERAAQLEPGNAAYHEQVAEACGGMAQHAGPLKLFGFARRLRKEAEQAVALDPRQLEAREILVEYFWMAPGIAGGDKKKSSAMAVEIARLSPERGAIVQGDLALRAKDPARAETLYSRAIAAAPSSYRAHVSLARVLATEGAWQPAEVQARAAMAADPGRALGYGVLAAALVHAQRWDELEAMLAECERQRPGDLSARYQAAKELLAEHGDSLRAERYLRQYLTVAPEGGAPSWARARWRLGQALERQGRTREAVAEVEAAVQMDPSFEDAKKDLKRMKRG